MEALSLPKEISDEAVEDQEDDEWHPWEAAKDFVPEIKSDLH